MVERILSQLPVKSKGILVRFTDDQLGSKLMSMGVLPQSVVKVVNKSPFGNTYIILVNERQRIALRKREAEHIIIK